MKPWLTCNVNRFGSLLFILEAHPHGPKLSYEVVGTFEELGITIQDVLKLMQHKVRVATK